MLASATRSVFFPALHTPVLSYNIEMPGDNKIRNVTINWTTPDGTKNDIEYHLSVNNSAHTTNWTTKVAQVNQSLTVGTRYTATVFSQRCDGTVKSNVSDPLDIFLKGASRDFLHGYSFSISLFLYRISNKYKSKYNKY